MYFTRMLGFCAALAALFVPGYSPVLARDSAHQVRPLPPLAAHASARAQMAQLPISFEPNVGQVDRRVAFLAHAGGTTLFLTSTGAVLTRTTTTSSPPQSRSSLHPQSRLGTITPSHLKQAVMRMMLVGSSAHPRFSAANRLPGIVNYFIGNDRTKWHANIPTYSTVTLHNVYPGIDQAWYGKHGTLEYDWLVHPGADPSRIALRILGARGLYLDRRGNLLSPSLLGSFGQHAPQTYQAGRPIFSRYLLDHSGLIRVRVGSYDHSRLLTIDPSLIYSTYLGGSGDDEGNGIAVDSGGNTYVTGRTVSPNFPTQNALQSTYGGGRYDAFVTKFTAAGSLAYSTYLGGSGDSGDWGYGIAVDSGGNAYVTGNTSSSNFPTLNAFQITCGCDAVNGYGDAFVTKLTATGTLAYSTYLGGSSLDWGNGIAVDSGGNAYMTGYTQSTNFPTLSAFQSACGCSGYRDAFVTKLTATGSLAYSTYLGGSGDDYGQGIAVDSGGNAYVTGATMSTNFPILSAFQSTYGGGTRDAFVTKLTATGSLAYSTYLGGSGGVQGWGIAVDSGGNAYVAGDTTGSLPTLNAFQSTRGGGYLDAFVTKFTATGSLAYSSYLGGSLDDQVFGIAVDNGGNAYVTGSTASTNFPTLNAVQSMNGGGTYDAFVTRLTAAGTLAYSTYLGGSGDDFGSGIAVESGGSAYVTGGTSSANFPVLNAFQSTFGSGAYDAFVTKLAATISSPPVISASPNPVPLGSSSTTVSWDTRDGSIGQVYVSLNGGTESLLAQGVSGSTSVPWITQPGTYLFTLYAGQNHAVRLTSVTVSQSPSISASPTTVTAPSTSTTITFSTGDGSTGQVYVSMDGGSEALVTQGSSGSFTAPWISTGHSYVFRLYAGTTHTTVLSSVTVTTSGSVAPFITASPATVIAPSTSTSVSYSTGDGSVGQVYASVDGGSEVLVAQSASGTVNIPWIQPGHTYPFKLYAGTAHTSLLASTSVTGQGSASISANPTSVSTSGGSGSTSITFSTGDGSTGQVYVSVNGGSDALVVQGSGSTFNAPWIQHSSSYVFKLYAGTSHTTVLGQVTVTGQ